MKAVLDVDPQPAKVLRLVLGDQLDAHHSWFDQVDPDVVYVIAELPQEQHYVRHHTKNGGILSGDGALCRQGAGHGS